MSTEHDWSIVTATNAKLAQAQVFRLRTEKPHGVHVTNLTTALTVTWKYGSGSMFPSGSEKEAILRFERELDPLSGDNGFCELVQVATGGGVKEWLYYVNDTESFLEAFNRYLAKSERYPIEIKWYSDPEWKIWREAVEMLSNGADRKR